ncbi:hypothetical protein [Kitasatospora aureofaciens]|uniref:hypothetical protein n=1 Tax=Kitasatospora aureofaciens TaxID=1894 RepID=UPI0037C612F3
MTEMSHMHFDDKGRMTTEKSAATEEEQRTGAERDDTTVFGSEEQEGTEARERQRAVYPGEATGNADRSNTADTADTSGRTSTADIAGTTGTTEASGSTDTTGTTGTTDTTGTTGTTDTTGDTGTTEAPGTTGTTGTGGGPDEAGDRTTRAEEGEVPDQSDEGRSADREPLLPEAETQELRERWQQVQTDFVDDPRQAVHTADALVADLMQRLAASFADRRSSLEGQWNRGDEVETEELRVALQQYRTFFNRLLQS